MEGRNKNCAQIVDIVNQYLVCFFKDKDTFYIAH